jgi:hypothetical protein
MIVGHSKYFAPNISVHAVTDDFGDVWPVIEHRAWFSAWRFVNGQTFEQANMRSIDCVVAEH